MSKLSVIYIVLLTYSAALFSQPDVSKFKEEFQLHANKTSETIKIDGKLDEETWKSAEIGTNFWLKVPKFAENADPKTQVYISYDDQNLYVAAKCFQKEKIITQTLRRDEYWNNDGIAVVLDPLNTLTNGFLFGTTAAGQQWDALRSLDDINSDWSNKWFSNVHVTDEFWSMEMAIPLRILSLIHI